MPTYRTVIVEPQQKFFRDRKGERFSTWTPLTVFFVCQNCAHVANVNRPADFKCPCECHLVTMSEYECGECGSVFEEFDAFIGHINEPHSSAE